jgi:hypothetical protein
MKKTKTSFRTFTNGTFPKSDILMLTQIRILKYDITWSEVIFQFTSCDTSNSEINYAFIICWYVHVLTYFHWMKHCMWHTITMKLISYLQCIQCTTHPVVAVLSVVNNNIITNLYALSYYATTNGSIRKTITLHML